MFVVVLVIFLDCILPLFHVILDFLALLIEMTGPRLSNFVFLLLKEDFKPVVSFFFLLGDSLEALLEPGLSSVVTFQQRHVLLIFILNVMPEFIFYIRPGCADSLDDVSVEFLRGNCLLGWGVSGHLILFMKCKC